MQPISFPVAESNNSPAPAVGRKVRALLLINRFARSGKNDISAVIERLRGAGVELLEEQVERPAQFREVIQRNRDRTDLIIIGGGDGTLSRAADALVDARLPLGVIPLGTANDL